MTRKFGTFEEPLADRYRFEAELGRGGMGTVYRAMDLRLGRPVAIKVLHPALTNDVGVARFQSEIRIAAGLRHARIVSVHDSGEAAGHLYYVMDFVDGETLRAKIKREKQLAVDDALAITTEVADGLQYAHDHGVVHRDVKPENIILCDGHACVVDFGLARALDSVDENRLTASGLAVGTPHYLSPEQASAEKDVGPKADQYALACVLYEMLAGEPPFTGPTASSIAMQHIGGTPVPLGKRRNVPTSVEAAIGRAMQKVSADRWPGVSAFVRQTTSKSHDHRFDFASALGRHRVLTWGIALLLLFGGLWVTGLGDKPIEALARTFGPPLDSTRYVILPFRNDTGRDTHFRESEIIYDAMTRWEGVRPVALYQVRDVVRLIGRGGLTDNAAGRAARKLGAGRYIWGELSRSGSSIRVHASVYNSDKPTEELGEATVHIDSAGMLADSLLSSVVDSLLFGRKRAAHLPEQSIGTKSRPARQAYLRGIEHTSSWELTAADSAFRSATEYDPQYARAYLWLAQVRGWARRNAGDLSGLTSRALADPAKLTPYERDLGFALASLSAGRYGEACIIYERLSRDDPTLFSAWYGVGECNAKDGVVLRAKQGWRFRSSYQRALYGYEKAFALLPSISRSYSGRAYSRLQTLLKTGAADLRYGSAEKPDTARFAAYASWIGDTLAFVPYPLHEIETRPELIPASLAIALDHQRDLFHKVAASWAASLPGDPGALEALAISLEMQGDRAAIDTLRAARRLSSDSSQLLRLSVREAWLRVKFGTPNTPDDLVAAQSLVDSIQKTFRPHSASEASVLLALAVLTGRQESVLGLIPKAEPASVVGVKIPGTVLQDGLAVQVYAANGGPADSLARAARRVERGIQSAVVPGARREVRQGLLLRAAMQAFPLLPFESLDSSDRASDDLLAAQQAFLRGDVGRATSFVEALAHGRRSTRPMDLSLDALVPEARLLAMMGDIPGAIERLDPTLNSLAASAPVNVDDYSRAAAISQGVQLRAELARCASDAVGMARWRTAAELLMPGRSGSERLACRYRKR